MERLAERGGSLASALVALLAGFLLVVLVDLVRDHVASSPRYAVSVSCADIANLPEALETRAWAILGDAPMLDRPRSILDPDLPEVAARALEMRPWVKRVLEARRSFPARLELKLEVRRPLAVVCAGSERLAVDDEGVVLERATDFGPPLHPEIRIAGARISRVPYDGEPFGQPGGQKGHDAVLEALALLRDLRAEGNHPALESVRVIEVQVGDPDRPRRSGDSDLLLRLDSGVQLLWGRSSIAPLARIEPSPCGKLENLLLAMRTFPGLLGVIFVDLRLGPAEVVLAAN
jgi:hypothetical protein